MKKFQKKNLRIISEFDKYYQLKIILNQERVDPLNIS